MSMNCCATEPAADERERAETVSSILPRSDSDLFGGGLLLYLPAAKEDCLPRTACAAPKSRKLQVLFLWIVTVLVLALLVFPYVVPYLPI